MIITSFLIICYEFFFFFGENFLYLKFPKMTKFVSVDCQNLSAIESYKEISSLRLILPCDIQRFVKRFIEHE